MTALILAPALLLALPASAQTGHAMPMNMPMPAQTQQKPKPKPRPNPTPPARAGSAPHPPATSPAAKPVQSAMPMHEHDPAAHDAMIMPDDDAGATSSAPHAHHDMAGMTMPMAQEATDSAAPTTPTPPPPQAGTGPARAADAIWGADAMRASRAELRDGMGGQTLAKVMIDRLEYRARDGRDGYGWEGQAWIGDDLDRLTIRSEGEGNFGGEAEQAEVQALWSHAIGPWFDLQTGVRHDFTGPARTHAVIGVQGIAPYRFDVSAQAFLSDKGDLTARAEAELDQRITQRLIVQPRAELNFSAQDIPELGVGAGLDKIEVGVRLRYEFAREFAPYIGVSHEARTGQGADFARARGEDSSATSFVIGLRSWF